MNFHNSSFKDSANALAQKFAITSLLQLICGRCLHQIWFHELTFLQMICGDIALKVRAGNLGPFYQGGAALKTINAIQIYVALLGNALD